MVTKEDVLEFISNLSELSELVKEFEEKFQVSNIIADDYGN